jgi:hypothetical protein
VFIWRIFSSIGIMCQEKSGNPGSEHQGWADPIRVKSGI